MRRISIIALGVIVLATAVAVQARQRQSSSDDTLHSESEGPRFKRVRLATGIELEVAESGPANGRPLLFLHGYSDSWFSFSLVLAGLPPDIRAIVPSQRGHGESDRPQCCYLLADLAQDAVALLDALDIERASVVGHSTGSFVAQLVALDHPARVDRLVLIGTGNTHAVPVLVELEQAVQALPDPIPTEFIHEFQAGTALQPLPPGFLDRVIAESSKLPAFVWRDVMTGVLAADGKDRLDRIQASTLVLWGEEDPILPRASQSALLYGLPRARLIAYPGVSHAPHWEVPDRVTSDIVAFLNETDAAGAPVRREHAAHDAHDAHAHDTAPTGPIPLLHGLGTWRRDITTRSADAQRYFDQGLRLTYAFNHDEAVRSFERAVEHDPTCALCYWGVAYALGPNINMPMEATIEPRALAAIRKALELRAQVTSIERALIDAMAERYGEPGGADRAARDSAYAIAMREVAQRFDDDADAQVLYADAMLNLRPWNQWTRGGQPQPGTLELVRALERVRQRFARKCRLCGA